MRIILIFCFLRTLIMSDLFSQNSFYRLNGFVYDFASGEALVGATIFLPQLSKGVITDSYGRYSLVFSEGSPKQLQISYVGYQQIDTVLTLPKDQNIDFRLHVKNLPEVEIKSRSGNLLHNTLQIPVERLKAIPMLFGQPDLIKALSFLPGVSTGIEGTTGLYVRGGTPDQNLILLDGATVYNASHLFGFQSVFDPNAIKDIKLIKGGFPARYGGRLSSIIDITMKEGNNQLKHGEFTLGIINSGLLLEGPIKKSSSSYMVSARAAYLGLLLLPSALGWKKKDDAPFNTMISYDLNFKLNHLFKNKNKIFASAYFGHDKYLTRFRSDSSYYRTDLGWGNETASLRYIHSIGNAVHAQSIATYNAYKSIEYNDRSYISGSQAGSFLRKSSIQDISFKQLISSQAKRNLKLSSGIELLWQMFQPSSISLESSDFNLDSLSRQNEIFKPFSFALFGEGEWDLFTWLNINIGLRRSNYQVSTTTKGFWEPRLNINIRNGQFSYNAAYAFTSQFVHLLSNNSLGLFSDLWVPSTSQVAPQYAQQYSGGIIYRSPSLTWEFSLEGYYKNLFNQIDYRQGIDFFDINNYNWQNTIEQNGIGKAKGIELMVKRETDRSNIWFAYTLSDNKRKFTNINRGEWYPFRYDKRHNFNISLVRKLENKWTFGLNFVYQTGTWITLKSAWYQGEGSSAGGLIRIVPQPGGYSHLTDVIKGRNNQRLPDYHRLDLSFTRNFISKKRQFPSQLSLSLYNAYARKNPYVIYTGLGTIYKDMKIVEYRSSISSKALFVFIPAISYTKKW